MTPQSIVLPTGRVLTGRLLEHLGQGRVVIEYQGLRTAGEKLESWQRRNRAIAPGLNRGGIQRNG